MPGPVTDIIFDINNTDPVAGDEVDVNVTARDQYGNINNTPTINIYLTMEDVLSEPHNENIALSEVMGNMFEISIDHNNMTSVKSVEGTGLLLRINSTLAGTLSIGSDLVGITNNTSVVYAPSSPYSMEALYDREYLVNTTSDIVVSLYDRYDNPIEGATLTFNLTSPADTIYNSPITYGSAWLSSSVEITPVDGTATVSFRTDKRAGGNIVNVDALNTSLFLRLSITGTSDIATALTLSATPSSCYANNEDSYRLSAQVIDQFSNPLLPGNFQIKDRVLFESNSGSTLIPLNGYGVGTTVVGPTPYVENITVTATYKNETGSTDINASKELSFTEGPLSIFNFYANPDKVLLQNISGNHNSSVILIAFDAWGHTLQDVNISLNNTAPSMGTLSMDGYQGTNVINATTDQYGRVNALFTSSNIVDNCTLIATSGVINDSMSIEIKDEPFLSAYIDAEPYIVNSGDIVNVTTIITVEGELPISRSAATSMLVLDRSGSMDPDYYAGTPLDVILVLDRSGSMEYLGTTPEQPLTDAKSAAKVFMENLVSNAEVGVVSFATYSAVDQQPLPLNLSGNKDLLHNAIDSMDASGYTAMGDGMVKANALLINGRPGAKKIMIVLTDGVTNRGSDPESAISTANLNNIRIYTIGLGSSELIDETLLEHIASETGGSYYNAPSSSELQTVYNAIAKEISDFDVTEIDYGAEGFTPYSYAFEDELTLTFSHAPYILKYDVWDIDNLDENCGVYVNGNYVFEIPVTGGEKWSTFEHDISSEVLNGTNTIIIEDPMNSPNSIRNLGVFADGILLASKPSETTYTSAEPYVINFNTSYYGYENVFQVNEEVNDLKVMASWAFIDNDLDVRLTSPSGISYGKMESTSGYFTDERSSVDINVRDAEFDTYITSLNPDTNYEASTSLFVTSDLNDTGDQAASMMKWRLPSAPTHNTTIRCVKLYLTGMDEPDIGWDAGTDSRTITVYDLLTPYSSPTWDNNATSQIWVSGSFSNSDYENSYAIDALSLSSSVSGDVVEFNITDSMWGSDRVPEWDDECSLVLVGSNYGGTDANPSVDRFASSDTNANDHTRYLNGWKPLVVVEYSITKDTSEFVWVQPTSYDYPDLDMVETGNWTVQVSSYSADGPFTLNTFIDKKSATQIASRAFISSFDENRGDLSGLVLYSDNNVVTSDNQSSYLRNSSEWVSYFTPETDASHSFELFWNDSSTLDMALYEGTKLLASSTGSNPKVLNSSLLIGNDYYLIVNKTAGNEDDTFFTINATNNDAPYLPMELNWKEWRATVTSSLAYNSFDHLENSIDTITADGMTAIDEGLYAANNELSAINGNSTVVLMTDGLDNAGHHSLIEEALRAKEHNTTIYTVGLGNNEGEVDPILYEIANMTGGEYYFAPNSTVLEDIFVGIASDIANFTASGPTLSIHIPNNYIKGLSVATATYIPNSTNSTFGNATNYSIPMAPPQGNAEPTISTEGSRSELLWDLPSMIPGQKWGVWYQLKVQGAGSVPLILPTSSLSYTDVNETTIDININYEGETGISGFGADVDYVSLGSISIVPESPTVLIDEDAILNLKAFYSDGNPAIVNMQIYSSIGAFNETENPMNITVSGSDQINLMSTRAGTANIKAIGSNGNNSVSDDTVVYIRPKGVITLS
ncbi:VWA domain-containing protein [Methanococcoides alaskense]|uniref:VWA domain-containing protein n=1 Tax=Methanococcoides alaskense TaxID=325778 RepID=UPI002869F000|nr:VWA domain-containing protein [Methanococcoides alaskense]